MSGQVENNDVEDYTVDGNLDTYLNWINQIVATGGRGRASNSKTSQQSLDEYYEEPDFPTTRWMDDNESEIDDKDLDNEFNDDNEPIVLFIDDNLNGNIPPAPPLPNDIVIPPPPPIPVIPPPPLPDNFLENVPARAKKIAKKLKKIAELAEFEAGAADDFVDSQTSYYQMDKKWPQFKSTLRLNKWLPNTDSLYDELTSELLRMIDQLQTIRDNQNTDEYRAARKALKKASSWADDAQQRVHKASEVFSDIDDDFAEVKSPPTLDPFAILRQDIKQVMKPQKQANKRDMERQIEEFEEEQAHAAKQLQELKAEVASYAIIKDIAEARGKSEDESYARVYDSINSHMDAEEYEEVRKLLKQNALYSHVAMFIGQVQQRVRAMQTTMKGLNRIQNDDKGFTDLRHRVNTMVQQLGTQPPVPAWGLLSELDPLVRQATKLAGGDTWENDLVHFQSLKTMNKPQAATSERHAVQALAVEVSGAIDFEQAFTDISTHQQADPGADANFRRDIIEPTQKLLSECTADSVKDDESRKKLIKALKTHSATLSEAQDDLLDADPMSNQQIAHLNVIGGFQQAIKRLVEVTLNKQHLKELVEKDMDDQMRKKLSGEGHLDRIRDTVSRLTDPTAAMDVDNRVKEIVGVMEKLDHRTCKVIVESLLETDGLAVVLQKLKVAKIPAAVEAIREQKGDDQEYIDGLFGRLIEAEVANTPNMGTFMRSTTPVGKLMEAFTNDTPDGQEFIRNGVQPALDRIRNLKFGKDEDLFSMEIDLKKLVKDHPDQFPDQNNPTLPPEIASKHLDMARQTIDEITSRMPPPEVTRTCALLYEKTLAAIKKEDAELDDNRTPEQKALALVGGHVMLRMMNPGITANIEELKKRTKDQKTAAKIQGKILQRLSNLSGAGDVSFHAAFPDLVFDKDGKPTPEAVQLQEYYKKIVYAGQAAQGKTIPDPEITEDVNKIAQGYHKACAFLDHNLKSVVKAMKKDVAAKDSVKSLEQFHAAFPFDLVQVLHSLATAINNKDADNTRKLMSIARGKAVTTLTLLNANDKVLWKAEGALDNPVQLRGPLKRFLNLIVTVSGKNPAVAAEPARLDANEVRTVAQDKQIDDIMEAYRGSPPPQLREAGVLMKKLKRLRALIQENDPKATDVATELRPAIPRVVRQVHESIRAELQQQITVIGDVFAVSENNDAEELLNQLTTLRNEKNLLEVHKQLRELSNTVKNLVAEVGYQKPEQLFQRFTSTGDDLTADNWGQFVSTLSETVRSAHQGGLDRIKLLLTEFEGFQENVKSNLLNAEEIAKESKCLNSLIQRLKSIQTSDNNLSQHVNSMLNQIGAFVKKYNEQVSSQISIEAIWNFDGGPEYLLAAAEDIDAAENFPFLAEAKKVMAKLNDDDPKASATLLKEFVDKHRNPNASSTVDYLTVNVAGNAPTNIKKGRDMLDKLPDPSADNYEQKVKQANRWILRGLKSANGDLNANLRGVLSARKGGFTLTVDL